MCPGSASGSSSRLRWTLELLQRAGPREYYPTSGSQSAPCTPISQVGRTEVDSESSTRGIHWNPRLKALCPPPTHHSYHVSTGTRMTSGLIAASFQPASTESPTTMGCSPWRSGGKTTDPASLGPGRVPTPLRPELGSGTPTYSSSERQ